MQKEMHSLLLYLRSLSPLTDENWSLLQSALSIRTYQKNEFLLKEGEVCNELFFIVEGYCKSFCHLDGERKNTGFFFENEIATNVASFGSGEKSAYNIMACEPLTVVVFDKVKLFEISHQSAAIEALGRNCLRTFAAKQEEQATIFKLYSAQERLEFFEKRYPQMLQRVSLSQLASFFGVVRETLSRIRRKRVS